MNKQLLRWTTVLFVLGVAIPVLIAACGGTAQPPQEFTIIMSDYAYEPNDITFEAGREVVLTLVNEGAVEHEFLIGKGGPEGFTTDLFDYDAANAEIVSGEDYFVGSPDDILEEGYHVEVEPGGEVVMSFTVPEDKAGSWQMGCFIDDGAHWLAGMEGVVEITN